MLISLFNLETPSWRTFQKARLLYECRCKPWGVAGPRLSREKVWFKMKNTPTRPYGKRLHIRNYRTLMRFTFRDTGQLYFYKVDRGDGNVFVLISFADFALVLGTSVSLRGQSLLPGYRAPAVGELSCRILWDIPLDRFLGRIIGSCIRLEGPIFQWASSDERKAGGI